MNRHHPTRTVVITFFWLTCLFLSNIAKCENIFVERYFCKETTDLQTINPSQDCQNKQRTPQSSSTNYSNQLILIRVNNTSKENQTRTLLVAPFHLTQVKVYKSENNKNSEIGNNRENKSTSLGGHRFQLNLPPGETNLIIDIYSPKIAHIYIDLENNVGFLNTHQLLLATHIGMLLLLFVLALIGLSMQRTILQFKLTASTALVFISVLIGSGAVFIIWPSISPFWVGTIAFNSVNVLRFTCLTWLYSSMIQGNKPNKFYYLLRTSTYTLTIITLGLIIFDQQSIAINAGLLLAFLCFLTPTIGLISSKEISNNLRRILIISLAVYAALLVGSLTLMSMPTGDGNIPVYLSRAIDLLIPLGMLIVVFIRNKVIDQEYSQTKSQLALKESALEFERKAREEKRLLIDMLTHEIKNPLASISLAANTLTQHQTNNLESSNRRIQNISKSVKTIDEIIERCNLANGLEEDQIQINLELVDIQTLVLNLIATSTESTRINYESTRIKLIETDPYLLQIVVANLIDNALKYASPNSMINISISSNHANTNNEWAIKVSNEISPEITPNLTLIFQRYYRHPLAKHIRGSGLGLSLCKEICNLLNGNITVNTNNQEIIFEVRFKNA